jgi:protein-tyrosine phosphatase
MKSARITTPAIEALVADDRRVVPLFAVHNFRDLGGYPTVEGRETRWRTLFRADGLYRLTPDDTQSVVDLGVTTVVDLRSDNEVRARGVFPVGRHAVALHHLPIIDVTWGETETPDFDDAADYLVWAYREMLAEASPRFAEAMTLLAQQSALPAVFHCAAGKDRTGVLAALILGALGVDESIIAADYGLTEQAMQRLVVWARVHQPDLAEIYAKMPTRFAAADPRAMSVILADITSKHSTVRNFVREIGVSDETIAALARSVLTPR